MILPDHVIRDLRIVTPFEERTKFRGKSFGRSMAGYDIRADMTGLDCLDDGRSYRTTMTPDGNGIVIEPAMSVLVGIIEHFTMPDDVVGYAKDKSTWLRQGVFIGGPVFEPGWRGHPSIRVFNGGDEEVSLIHGEPIAQVLFHRIESPPTVGYDGKYQDQGPGPTGARS